MLNEVRARHIKKLVVDQAVATGKSVRVILDFEVARREDTIRGLDAQKGREEDEVVFLAALDEEELNKEVVAR